MTKYGVLFLKSNVEDQYTLKPGVCNIGGSILCDLRIYNKNVPDVQCVVEVDSIGLATIVSKNIFPQTKLNTVPLLKNKKVLLNNGDLIDIEGVEFVYKNEALAELDQQELVKKKLLLKPKMFPFPTPKRRGSLNLVSRSAKKVVVSSVFPNISKKRRSSLILASESCKSNASPNLHWPSQILSTQLFPSKQHFIPVSKNTDEGKPSKEVPEEIVGNEEDEKGTLETSKLSTVAVEDQLLAELTSFIEEGKQMIDIKCASSRESAFPLSNLSTSRSSNIFEEPVPGFINNSEIESPVDSSISMENVEAPASNIVTLQSESLLSNSKDIQNKSLQLNTISFNDTTNELFENESLAFSTDTSSFIYQRADELLPDRVSMGSEFSNTNVSGIACLKETPEKCTKVASSSIILSESVNLVNVDTTFGSATSTNETTILLGNRHDEACDSEMPQLILSPETTIANPNNFSLITISSEDSTDSDALLNVSETSDVILNESDVFSNGVSTPSRRSFNVAVRKPVCYSNKVRASICTSQLPKTPLLKSGNKALQAISRVQNTSNNDLTNVAPIVQAFPSLQGIKELMQTPVVKKSSQNAVETSEVASSQDNERRENDLGVDNTSEMVSKVTQLTIKHSSNSSESIDFEISDAETLEVAENKLINNLRASLDSGEIMTPKKYVEESIQSSSLKRSAKKISQTPETFENEVNTDKREELIWEEGKGELQESNILTGNSELVAFDAEEIEEFINTSTQCEPEEIILSTTNWKVIPEIRRIPSTPEGTRQSNFDESASNLKEIHTPRAFKTLTKPISEQEVINSTKKSKSFINKTREELEEAEEVINLNLSEESQEEPKSTPESSRKSRNFNESASTLKEMHTPRAQELTNTPTKAISQRKVLSSTKKDTSFINKTRDELVEAEDLNLNLSEESQEESKSTSESSRRSRNFNVSASTSKKMHTPPRAQESFKTPTKPISQRKVISSAKTSFVNKTRDELEEVEEVFSFNLSEESQEERKSTPESSRKSGNFNESPSTSKEFHTPPRAQELFKTPTKPISQRKVFSSAKKATSFINKTLDEVEEVEKIVNLNLSKESQEDFKRTPEKSRKSQNFDQSASTSKEIGTPLAEELFKTPTKPISQRKVVSSTKKIASFINKTEDKLEETVSFNLSEEIQETENNITSGEPKTSFSLDTEVKVVETPTLRRSSRKVIATPKILENLNNSALRRLTVKNSVTPKSTSRVLSQTPKQDEILHNSSDNQKGNILPAEEVMESTVSDNAFGTKSLISPNTPKSISIQELQTLLESPDLRESARKISATTRSSAKKINTTFSGSARKVLTSPVNLKLTAKESKSDEEVFSDNFVENKLLNAEESEIVEEVCFDDIVENKILDAEESLGDEEVCSNICVESKIVNAEESHEDEECSDSCAENRILDVTEIEGDKKECADSFVERKIIDVEESDGDEEECADNLDKSKIKDAEECEGDEECCDSFVESKIIGAEESEVDEEECAENFVESKIIGAEEGEVDQEECADNFVESKIIDAEECEGDEEECSDNFNVSTILNAEESIGSDADNFVESKILDVEDVCSNNYIKNKSLEESDNLDKVDSEILETSPTVRKSTKNISIIQKVDIVEDGSSKTSNKPTNDLTSIAELKRLLAIKIVQKGPRNDLTEVKGLKKLMATPKVQKGPRNDLTEVKGLKKLMATPKLNKSPLNDLTDVRGVKKVLATPKARKEPLNDLREIKGVKKLMATPKVRNSPNNELSDLRGVKKIMATPKVRKSPKNSLNDVSGVEKLFRSPKVQNLPKNDLTDVVGVKKLFADHEASYRRQCNITGVAELMNESNNLFDALVNKKPVRTYGRKSSTFNKSVDSVSPHVSTVDAPIASSLVVNWINTQEFDNISVTSDIHGDLDAKNTSTPIKSAKKKQMIQRNTPIKENIKSQRGILKELNAASSQDVVISTPEMNEDRLRKVKFLVEDGSLRRSKRTPKTPIKITDGFVLSLPKQSSQGSPEKLPEKENVKIIEKSKKEIARKQESIEIEEVSDRKRGRKIEKEENEESSKRAKVDKGLNEKVTEVDKPKSKRGQRKEATKNEESSASKSGPKRTLRRGNKQIESGPVEELNEINEDAEVTNKRTQRGGKRKIQESSVEELNETNENVGVVKKRTLRGKNKKIEKGAAEDLNEGNENAGVTNKRTLREKNKKIEKGSAEELNETNDNVGVVKKHTLRRGNKEIEKGPVIDLNEITENSGVLNKRTLRGGNKKIEKGPAKELNETAENSGVLNKRTLRGGNKEVEDTLTEENASVTNKRSRNGNKRVVKDVNLVKEDEKSPVATARNTRTTAKTTKENDVSIVCEKKESGRNMRKRVVKERDSSEELNKKSNDKTVEIDEGTSSKEETSTNTVSVGTRRTRQRGAKAKKPIVQDSIMEDSIKESSVTRSTRQRGAKNKESTSEDKTSSEEVKVKKTNSTKTKAEKTLHVEEKEAPTVRSTRRGKTNTKNVQRDSSPNESSSSKSRIKMSKEASKSDSIILLSDSESPFVKPKSKRGKPHESVSAASHATVEVIEEKQNARSTRSRNKTASVVKASPIIDKKSGKKRKLEVESESEEAAKVLTPVRKSARTRK